ncbi:MAG: cytidylate kinase family protein [Betaproteobacteria bacterium]|nr:cytidylate kinase family protein [Betaproteobacteria bacterium]
MPVVAITREMGSLGKDVAAGIGEALGIPVLYHEVIEHLADRMRVRKSHVIRLLDGSAGLMERLTADKTSLAIFSADEIYGLVLKDSGAVIRGWGATHLLRDVPHVVCVRVCAPLPVRKRRMMERLNTDEAERVSEEIRCNDEAHTAIMRRHFGLQWTDAENYDVVLNTERVRIDDCVEEVLGLVRSLEFAETENSRQKIEDLAISARVRAALRCAPETREMKFSVATESARVSVSGGRRSLEERVAIVDIAGAVDGVRHVEYRSTGPEDPRTPQD